VVLQVASARVPSDEKCTSVSFVTFFRLTIKGHVADGDKALVVVVVVVVVVATTTTIVVVVIVR
jgi:hypothetical protein